MTIGSRRRIDRDRLFEVIPDYAKAEDDDARDKMFERDKAHIRALGIPLIAEEDPFQPGITFYRIDSHSSDDALELSDAEYTILLAASRAWDDAAAGGAARRVRAKLNTYDRTIDPNMLEYAGRARVESLPVLSPLLDAVTQKQAVSFQYRSLKGEVSRRSLEPWNVGVVDGHWYVLGYDRQREAERVFRASRIESFPRLLGSATQARPPQASLTMALQGWDVRPEHATLSLAISPYKALDLRSECGIAPEVSHAQVTTSTRTRTLASLRRHARWIEIEAPAQWRAEQERIFGCVARMHEGASTIDAVESASVRDAPRIRVTPTGTDHVARLIAIAAHVQQEGEVDRRDLAERFGITEKQLIKDLEVLFLCGDLGAGWEDLIDAEWDGGVVRVHNAAPLRRAIHPTESESIALLAGLSALGNLSGETARVAESVRSKLTARLGVAKAGEGSLPVSDSHEEIRTTDDKGGDRRLSAIRAAIHEAMTKDAPLQILYSAPDRPLAQWRSLAALSLNTTMGRTYVEGVVPSFPEDSPHGDDGHRRRQFRIDRIVDTRPVSNDELGLGEDPLPPHVPPGIEGREEDATWVALTGSAQWIAEAFEAEEVRDAQDGRVFARLHRPVRSALLDAVLECGGTAELLSPVHLRANIAQIAREAESRHRPKDR